MTEEIITTGEKFYCLIQDIEEYIQHNSLEQDKELDFILSQSEELQSDYARLEQENKELKKEVQLFKCLDTFGESECHCACRCLGNEFCEDADKKINTYRSALEEIREVAKRAKSDICNNCGWHNTDSCEPQEYTCGEFIRIQNKIDEVLND